jgi:uncharacterized SAM-binding protein YcdF (DUF218 family)
MRKKTKWILGGICLPLCLLIILIFLFRTPILMRAGQFMAPIGNDMADIAILEGNDFIDRAIVTSGMKLLATGKVKRLMIVLHNIAPSHRPFALNEDYPMLVKRELQALGLKEKEFTILVTHIHEPITLTAARGAMEKISKENIKSAVLVSEGFHTRRSYLVYQHVSNPLGIKIFPSAYFNSYQLNHWWSQEGGLREFSAEFVKLIYYWVRGYIPFKLSYA